MAEPATFAAGFDVHVGGMLMIILSDFRDPSLNSYVHLNPPASHNAQ